MARPEFIHDLGPTVWRTEPMFNEIKHAFGVARAWQQKSRTQHRWVTILCVAYSLSRMLALVLENKKNENVVPHIAWRQKSPMTAGLIRKGIQLFFSPACLFHAMGANVQKICDSKEQYDLILHQIDNIQ